MGSCGKILGSLEGLGSLVFLLILGPYLEAFRDHSWQAQEAIWGAGH